MRVVTCVTAVNAIFLHTSLTFGVQVNQGQQTRKTFLEPAAELEHLTLAAQISGIQAEIVLPQRREMATSQMRLHYLDWGTTGRRPIVFLHGAALNAHT